MSPQAEDILRLMEEMAEQWDMSPRQMQKRDEMLRGVAEYWMQEKLRQMRAGHQRLMTYSAKADGLPTAFDPAKPLSIA